VTTATRFSLVYGVAAGIALVAFAVMWRRRGALGARPLALMMLAAGVWALADAVELQVPTIAGKRLVSQIQYLGVVSAAPFFFHAAMALGGRGRDLSPRLLAAVWAVPLISLVMAWTSAWHGLLWSNIVAPLGASPFATYEYGWWFWVLTAQHYLLMAAATVVLLTAIRRVGRAFRTTMVLVVLAVMLPWIGNAAYNAKVGPWPGLNWLTLSLGVSGWLLVWAVLREGLLDLLPQAREVLIEMMGDGVLVLDRDGDIMYGNRAARQTLRLDSPSIAGAIGVISMKHAPVDWRGESLVEGGGVQRWLDIGVGPVFDRWGDLAGRIVVARDVTVQKNLEDERERLIDDLQDALRTVTTLEGMLPICAHCRNVRDDRGYWSRIEDYIGSRTPLEFTHAICPDCMGRFFPDPGGAMDHGGSI
jgi:PAS domain-containing protein